MGQKNKGRPKRRGDRQFQPVGDHGAGRSRQHQGKSKEDRQGDRRPGGKPYAAGRRESSETMDRDQERGGSRKGSEHFRNRPRDDKNARRFEERRPASEEGSASGARFEGHKHRRPPAERPRSTSDAQSERPERLWIYGRHAALAAIANPRRKIKRILVNESALEWINELRVPRERLATLTKVPPNHLDAALHSGAVHQGIAVEVEDLPRARLKEDCQPDGLRPVVVLDQITDPHNIGAIIRSAAAFNARAILVQDRRTPPLAGALAKAAAGALEAIPCVQAVNIARSLEGLKSLGYFCAGLAGDSAAPIASIPEGRPVALVLGAEGAGLRKLVRDTCDGIFAIPIAKGVDSLNVSTAAAVALYELARR